MVENLFKNKYYLVIHRFNGKRYRAVAPSKNRLKKMLPRFDGLVGYHSFWNIEEIDEKKYKRMSHLKDAPIWEKTYEDKNET